MPSLNDLHWLFALAVAADALSIDPANSDSVKNAATTITTGIMNQYSGNKTAETPGLFPDPSGWWSDGVVWDGMVDYWFLTGDTSYNDAVANALQFQVGDNNDYQPVNQTKVEGNDDQSTWALAALTAAERNFSSASQSSTPSWPLLATNVFNDQVSRWDTTTCTGGLRWQIFTFNSGYNYKNSEANGNFFQLAARLAHFTGNSTYSDWAEKTFDWMQSVGFLTAQGAVYDGADTTLNCSQVNKVEWSMNAGVLLYGSAVMYNVTNGNGTWHDRVTTLLSNIQAKFFSNNIMIEPACENTTTCDADDKFFKGVLARDMARTTAMAPCTESMILPLLQSTTKAVADSGCTNSNGTCGFVWTGPTNNGTDLGSDYSALEVVLGNLVIGEAALQTTNGTSGQGSGNSTSGSGNAPKHSGGISTLAPKRAIWWTAAIAFLVGLQVA